MKTFYNVLQLVEFIFQYNFYYTKKILLSIDPHLVSSIKNLDWSNNADCTITSIRTNLSTEWVSFAK